MHQTTIHTHHITRIGLTGKRPGNFSRIQDSRDNLSKAHIWWCLSPTLITCHEFFPFLFLPHFPSFSGPPAPPWPTPHLLNSPCSVWSSTCQMGVHVVPPTEGHVINVSSLSMILPFFLCLAGFIYLVPSGVDSLSSLFAHNLLFLCPTWHQKSVLLCSRWWVPLGWEFCPLPSHRHGTWNIRGVWPIKVGSEELRKKNELLSASSFQHGMWSIKEGICIKWTWIKLTFSHVLLGSS